MDCVLYHKHATCPPLLKVCYCYQANLINYIGMGFVYIVPYIIIIYISVSASITPILVWYSWIDHNTGII